MGHGFNPRKISECLIGRRRGRIGKGLQAVEILQIVQRGQRRKWTFFSDCRYLLFQRGISLLGGHGHDGGRARIALKHGSFGNSQRVEIPDIAAADGALRAVQQEPDSGFHSGIFPDNRGVLAVFDFYGEKRCFQRSKIFFQSGIIFRLRVGNGGCFGKRKVVRTAAQQNHAGGQKSKDVRAAFHTVPSFHGNEQCGIRAIALSFGFGGKYHSILILL